MPTNVKGRNLGLLDDVNDLGPAKTTYGQNFVHLPVWRSVKRIFVGYDWHRPKCVFETKKMKSER